MARPSDWYVLGLDRDPTPGVVESVQALAKQFGDFAHDVESAWRQLNSFGGDPTALSWVGQSADSFKTNFGPLPGRLQKLYTSYSEASDALSQYWPKLQAAQNKADAALRAGRDAEADVTRATGTANTAAANLKTAQAGTDPVATTDAQTAHDTAQKNLTEARTRLAALTTQANQASDDRLAAARICAGAIHKAQSDGIHNKHWWEHVGEELSEWGGKIAEIAGDLAPILDIIALATSWIPGVDVVTAALAEADNLIALAGSILQMTGDAMQGHWGDALLSAGMLAATYVGGRALGSLGGKVLGKLGTEAEEGGASALTGAEHGAEGGIGDGVRGAEGNNAAVCETDPVDVVSGWMLTDETDLTLAGVLPVVLRRAYASGYTTGRLFGPGWASTLDQRLAVNAAGLHFAGDDAQTLHYPTPAGDEPVLPGRGARWPLVWDRATDEIRITDPRSGQTRHFALVHFHNEAGQIRDLTAVTDRNGNRISILRTDDGTPVGVEHSGGYRVAVDSTVLAQGPRITGLRLLDGSEDGVLVKQFRYDDGARLIEVVDSSGVPLRYEHDEADRVTAWIDRVGYRYTYEYDSGGKVVRTGGDDGFMAATLVHDEDARTTTITNAVGGVTRYRYDEAGHITQVTDALGGVTMFEHDDVGQVVVRTDALGHTTRITRDANGDVTHVARPDETNIGIAYHEALRTPVQITGPDGAIWRYAHDAAGNVVRAVDPAGSVFVLSYDAHGAVISSTDALGHVTAIATDGAGLPVAVTDPLGAVSRIRRDAFGRPVEFAGPNGVDLALGWTTEGLPAWRTTADGVRSTWRYDAAGNLLEHQDPNGGVTAFEYGPFAKPVARTGADGARVEFAYDAELRLTSVTNPLGQAWRYAYDAAGNLVGETDFGGRGLTYRHDALGRVVERVNGAGQAVRLERDALGRVVAQSEEIGGVTRFEYDRAGRMSSALGAAGSLSYTRDVLGRIVGETVDGRTLQSAYDGAGRRTRRVTPTGAVSEWAFNPVGKPVSLDTSLGGALSFGYDGAGHEVSRLLGPVTELVQTFDEMGRLAGQLVQAHEQGTAGGARTLQQREYSYRADGAPVGISDLLRGTRTYALDPIGRVTAVDAATWQETYAYDALGNLTASALPEEGAATAAPVARRDRIHQERDGQGRVTRVVRRTLSGQTREWRYAWDAFDRLLETVTPDRTVWRYTYDAVGRRTAKVRLAANGDIAEQVLFTWDGARIAEQTRYAGAQATETLTWDHEPGTYKPAAQTRRTWVDEASQARVDAAFYAIVTDLVGAPQELVTPDGRVAWHTVTSLWGGVIADPGAETDCPLRFPGQYHDEETGWFYNYFRHYDPDSAGYVSPDPLGLTPAPSDTAYVANPLAGSDPLGLAPCYLTQTGQNTYESPAGLVYGPDPSPSFASRVDHVLNHNTDIPNRAQHGVFASPNENEVFQNIDEAYGHVQNGNAFSVPQGNRTVHFVNMGRPVGLIGGVPGGLTGNPTANYIQLVLDGNNVITAFPVSGIPSSVLG